MRKTDRPKSLTKKIVLVLLSIILVFNLLTISYGKLNKDKTNRFTSFIPFAFLSVESGSMEPEISKGDLLFIYEVPYEDIKVGDNVTYIGQYDLITHKVVEKNDSYFVTKGLENNINDDPVEKEAYCAKVILAIPLLGELLDILNTSLSRLLLIIFVVIIFYGKDIIEFVSKLIEKKRVKIDLKNNLSKLLIMCTLISVMEMSPYLTAAKYTKETNEFTIAIAGTTYFTSNYLSENGNHYIIGGWTGSDFTINLTIRNYENSLLFNKEDQDIVYEFFIEKDTDSEYKTDYEVSVTKSNDVLEAGDFVVPNTESWSSTSGKGFYGPYTISGNDEHSVSQNFAITITETGDNLSAGDKIKFRIVAATSASEMYTREILGDFEFRIVNEGTFLGQCTTSISSDLVTYTVVTNSTTGSNNRKIKVSWDPTKIYLNEFEPTAMTIISNSNYAGYFNRDEGYIVLPLSANARVSLQFFKKDGVNDSEVSLSAVEYDAGDTGPMTTHGICSNSGYVHYVVTASNSGTYTLNGYQFYNNAWAATNVTTTASGGDLGGNPQINDVFFYNSGVYESCSGANN